MCPVKLEYRLDGEFIETRRNFSDDEAVLLPTLKGSVWAKTSVRRLFLGIIGPKMVTLKARGLGFTSEIQNGPVPMEKAQEECVINIENLTDNGEHIDVTARYVE